MRHIDEPAAAAIALVERIKDTANSDDDLVRRGRFLSTSFELGIGSVPFQVTIQEGRIADVSRGPFLLRSWTFAIRAEPETWLALWKPMPDPGSHDLMALYKAGRVRLDGDFRPFMQNLQYIKDLLALPRCLPREV